MPNSDEETPESREAINATLRNILSTDGWGASIWDSVVDYLRKDFDIESDLLGLAQNAPCLIEMFQLGALARKGVIKKETRERLKEIIHNLVRIALHAETGDEESLNQLKVLHKITYPKNYDLPSTVIKSLADSYHTSPHLARAWSIRRLMLDLSYMVEPTRKEKSVLESCVRLTTSKVHLLDSARYEKAARHIKRNSTLQSLAMDIYLEELDKEGIHLESRQLKRDLQKLKEWESANPFDPSDYLSLWNDIGTPPARIPPIPIYSEGWKLRLQRSDKKQGRLS